MIVASEIEFPGTGPPEWYLREQQLKKRGWSFRTETMAELLARPEPSLEWLIQDLWVDKSRGLIAGHPGVGKTWIALDMLFAVSTGQLCMSRYKPMVQGPTLLVEEEASELNLARRIHSMARARHLKDSDLINFHHITRQFLKIPVHEKELIEFIKAHEIKLVIFDSLRRFHSAKENSSDEMQPVLESFARINILTGVSLILIHHLAKSGVENASKSIFERMRGTSDLWAWRDCIIGVEGEEDADTCKCSFQFRDAETTGSIQVKRCVGDLTGAIALEATPVEESEDSLEQYQMVIEFVKTQLAGASRNQICKILDGSKQDKLALIKRMIKQRLLVKLGSKLVVQNV